MEKLSGNKLLLWVGIAAFVGWMIDEQMKLKYGRKKRS